MFGIELIEFVAFGKQIGIVVAGAASLWGFVFWRSSRPASPSQGGDIAGKLLLPLFVSVGTCFVFWFWLVNLMPAYAHEGITLAPSREGMERALELLFPLFAAWFAFSFGGFMWWRLRKASFLHLLPWFFGIELAFTLVLASLPVWLGEWSPEQWFFIGHSVHSLFTLGTVMVLDYLFLISQRSLVLQGHLYSKFSTISKVIWLGLGIDFLSVFLVFDEALQLTPKFFFMQTVIGILVVNGVLLAGPVARRLQAAVREGGEALGRKWKRTAEVTGTISISSWFAITFVDFFQRLTLGYAQFLGFYAALIITLFLGHRLLNAFSPHEKIEEIVTS